MALLLLTACGSEASKNGSSTTGTTVPGSTAPTTGGPSTSSPPTDSTVPGVWVQPTAAPTLYYTDDRGVSGGPLSVVTMMSPDGTITELWSEMGEVTPRVLDVSADGTRVLVSRYSYAEGAVGFHLVEHELATGTETEIAQRDQYLVAKYALDGSGDVFVANTVDEVDSTGVITKETQYLNRVAHDGAGVVNLFVSESMETLMWQQVMIDGQLAVVIGGAPMTLVGGSGQAMPDLPVEGRSCAVIRQVDDADVLVSCLEPGEAYFYQLWLVPLDGSAPQQVTKVANNGSGADFGAGDLWTTTNGRQFVQRYGDCGAAWVEELQADGSSVASDAAGVILGVDGTRLITATTGSCDGTYATIVAYDTATGTTTTLLVPPATTDDHPYGANAFDILAIAR
jgi:hypothetical protein